MKIIVGKTAGFCYGVKRAVDGATELVKNDTNIYCLGELVHNKEVIKELTEQGMKIINNINEAKGTTIIRAHGVEKAIYDIAKENVPFDEYVIDNLGDLRVQYQSSFVINDDKYNWTGTVIL